MLRMEAPCPYRMRLAAAIVLALPMFPAKATFAENGDSLLDVRIATVNAREDADLATLDALMVAQRAFQLAVDTADASDRASIDVAHAVKDAYVSILRANAARPSRTMLAMAFACGSATPASEGASKAAALGTAFSVRGRRLAIRTL